MNYLEKQKLLKIIIQTCDKYNITAYEIEKNTGLNASGVHRLLNGEVEKPQEKTLNKILKYLENVTVGTNLDTKSENTTLLSEPNSKYLPRITADRVVPFYNIEINGSFISSFDDAKEYIEFYIDYKPLNDCTAYLPYFGSSMEPLYTSGNTLAVKQIFNFDVLLWGEPHLIITNEKENNLKTVKFIHPHPDPSKIILRAKNPLHAGDVVISKENILSLYIVRGKIELNQL